MSDRFLTTEEVAELFRTSPETVRYWRHVGSGPASFKVGRRVLYAADDVEAFIAAARAGSVVPERAATSTPEPGSVEALALGRYTTNRLKEGGVVTVAELEAKCAADLLDMPGIGWASVREVEDALAARGLSLSAYEPGRKP